MFGCGIEIKDSPKSANLIGTVLASEMRGQVVKLSGRRKPSSHGDLIEILIPSGLITRIVSRTNITYHEVYFLAGNIEDMLYIHQDALSEVVSAFKGVRG